MAGLTRLELATFCVTGRHSNQTELQSHIITSYKTLYSLVIGSKNLEPPPIRPFWDSWFRQGAWAPFGSSLTCLQIYYIGIIFFLQVDILNCIYFLKYYLSIKKMALISLRYKNHSS